VLQSIFRSSTIDEYHFENRQEFDLESLIGRLESFTYCPFRTVSDYSPLMKTVGKVFDRNQKNGEVVIEYDCVMYGIK
jgi:hypothetical protein